MSSTAMHRLFKSVNRRMRVAAVGRSSYWMLLLVGGVYALLLLASRLLSLLPDWFDLRSLLVVPALALLLGLLFHRRASVEETARAIDRKSGTKDLFLTASLLETSPGEFKPLVTRDAESRASAIHPGEVVSFQWGRRCAQGVSMLAILVAGIFVVPYYDPFGTVEAAENQAQKKKELEQSKKLTEIRLAEVQREVKQVDEAKDVNQAVDNLKMAFNKMNPNSKKQNFKRLTEQQKALAAKYQKMSTQRLREFLSQRPLSQNFTSSNEQLRKWMKELQQGSSQSLEDELTQIDEALQQLMKESDPVEQAKLTKKLRKRLQELADFAGRKANSNELTAALQRAMEQLELSKNDGLTSESLKALSESLSLSKMELQQLAQSIQDLKQLEEAMEALQKARQANESNSLDGEQCEGCQTLADYAALYEEMIGQMGPGQGEEGFGGGDPAEEDDSAVTDFKTEKSESAIKAGKILLTLKTKGLGEKGDVKTEYREAIRSVRQGYSEAILTEKIPPGYHEGIKKYFENITPPSDDAPSESSSPEKTDAEQ